LVLGTEFIFGLGCDSRVHTYPVHLSDPFPRDGRHFRSDRAMNTSTFYARLACSPCGTFGAVGATDGSIFLFDLTNQRHDSQAAIRLSGHAKEIGGIDWGWHCIASCSDDRTIRVWRHNEETYQSCLLDPAQNSWHWLWSM